MDIRILSKISIDERLRGEFERSLVRDNIQRGKLLAIVVIVFEAVYCIVDTAALIMQVDDRFNYIGYLAMYLGMIALNAVYLLILRRTEKRQDTGGFQAKRLNMLLVTYITLVLSWGSAVTLMDQRLYGQLAAFIINMITCSVVYVLDHRKLLVPYSVSVLLLALGLPFFQSSADILVGHYVNLLVFVTISWLASRIIYRSYCRDFISRSMLSEANRLLENEIEENRKITLQLALANSQLRDLTLLDDLTGIPNRRSFRDFIDREFETALKESSTLSVIMIDIDFFKQFNDRYGHEEGDRALIRIAGQLHSVVDGPDEFAVRWGGEEFVVAAFNSSRDEILRKAQVISEKIAALNIKHRYSEVSDRITASIGVATIAISDKRDTNKAVILADKALYLAKSGGRNCVRILPREERRGQEQHCGGKPGI